MQIDARFGGDTGMCLVNVLVDAPEELSYTDDQLECIAWGMIGKQGLNPMDVVDLFFLVRNGRGDWVHSTRDADSRLVPVSW